jgi:hypothetical protein
MPRRRVWEVVPYGDIWATKGQGSTRVTQLFKLKETAVARAEALANKVAGGRVIVRRADGSIETESTFGEEPADE